MMDLLGHRRIVLCGRLPESRIGRSVRVLTNLSNRHEQNKSWPEIRWDKVARIRRALQAGLYDVDARLEELLSN